MNRKSTAASQFAIICQSLYLANLLLLPGLCFCVLLYFYFLYRSHSHKKKHASLHVISHRNIAAKVRGMGRIHLIRSIQLSLLAGFVLGVVPLSVIFFSNQQDASIMVAVFYFVTLHATFVLIGMFNLSRAMANKLPLF